MLTATLIVHSVEDLCFRIVSNTRRGQLLWKEV